MKRWNLNLLFLVLLWSATFPGAKAQVKFTEVTSKEEMDAARKKASDQLLMVFVDVYATWCGPCKVMDEQVYTDPGVSEYMNEHFINVRLDGESEYGRQYAAEQQLEGYPSMFIFSREGEPVSRIVGFTPAEELISSLKGTLEDFRELKRYRTLHARGDLDDEGMANYIEVLRNMGREEEAEKLSGEYMERIMDPRLSNADISVIAFHMDIGNPWWDTFTNDPDRIRNVLGEDYLLAIEKIYNNTLVKAVDDSDIQMISRLSNELPPLVDGDELSAWDLRTMPFLQFYYYTDQLDMLIDYVNERFETDRKGDHRWLYGAASQITDMDQQYMTGKLLEQGVEWYQTCIDSEEHFDYYFYHGMVLFFLKRQEEAMESFTSAESMAETDEQKQMIAQVLQYVRPD